MNYISAMVNIVQIAKCLSNIDYIMQWILNNPNQPPTPPQTPPPIAKPIPQPWRPEITE